LIIENKKRQAIRENYFDGSGDGPIESIADLYSDGSDAEDTAPQKHSTSTLSSGGVGDDSDPLSCIVDLREYDVPYTMRAAIDMDLRVGAWYSVTPDGGSSSTCSVSWQKELLELCEPKILAFDIECEKSPLKFPNAESDRIYMISYMVKGQGYLIINRY
jgi:DNA polymerase elongation subunit (family B)